MYMYLKKNSNAHNLLPFSHFCVHVPKILVERARPSLSVLETILLVVSASDSGSGQGSTR